MRSSSSSNRRANNRDRGQDYNRKRNAGFDERQPGAHHSGEARDRHGCDKARRDQPHRPAFAASRQQANRYRFFGASAPATAVFGLAGGEGAA
jgi:hypothetical protein